MVRRKKTQVGVTVKPTLTKEEKDKLRKAIKGVNSILDAHNLDTYDLPGGVRINYKRARK
jgi:hypothetical protein